jgi:hypothetical protein
VRRPLLRPRLPTLLGIALLAGLFAGGAAAVPQATVTVAITGSGTVTSNPSGISCPSTCSASFTGRTVTLAEQPADGWAFQGWGGACAGQPATGCTLTLTADVSVSATFVLTPKRLVVVVRGSGRVTSTPPGINCPTDCEETYPGGNTTALTPVPASGFSFDHWLGACSGSGACNVTMNGPKYVGALFKLTSPPGPFQARGDHDGDGVQDVSDACEHTPPRAKLLAEGCSASDLPGSMAGLTLTLSKRLGYAHTWVGRIPGLESIGTGLDAVKTKLLHAADRVARGDPCGGAAEARSASAYIDGFGTSAHESIAGVQASLMRQKPTGNEDDENDVAWAELHYRTRLLDAGLADGKSFASLLVANCAHYGKKFVTRGRIDRVLDESRVFVLSDGRQFSLPLRTFRAAVYAGANVSITALTGISAPSLTLTVDNTIPVQNGPPPELAPCVQLRIAPIQNPNDPLVLQDPAGYTSGALWLEFGDGFAATKQCATGKGRYSLEIDVDDNHGKKTTLATDLTSADSPVLPSGSPWVETLTVILHHQGSNCQYGPTPHRARRVAKAYPCPITEVSKTTYGLRVLNPGFYGGITYSKTLFDLENTAPETFQVNSVKDLHFTLPANTGFGAEAYTPTGNQTTGPVKVVHLNQDIALWPTPTDFFSPDMIFPLATVGVDHPAGLEWPHLEGKRNGKPFWYWVDTPNLVRDLLAFCPPDNCFYSDPWAFGEGYPVSQGNNSPDPKASHCCPPQNFAFDLGMPDHYVIHAARGGVIGDFVDTNTVNADPCTMGDAADAPANYIRIDHEDGTFSWYAHIVEHSVMPKIGDTVTRGQLLAKVDNIGRSCGPHLHFQATTDTPNTIYEQTFQIRFETWVQGQAGPYVQDCYIPQVNDVLISANS